MDQNLLLYPQAMEVWGYFGLREMTTVESKLLKVLKEALSWSV